MKIFVGRTENFTVCSYNNEDSSTQFLLNFDEWNESYDILSCTDFKRFGGRFDFIWKKIKKI